VVCVGNVGIHIDVPSMGIMDEDEWIYNRMTALWYKWYIHLREEGGYSIGTALVAGWWNASINEAYWTEGPKKWVDNRPERPYRG
jgi:hypothetical protein